MAKKESRKVGVATGGMEYSEAYLRQLKLRKIREQRDWARKNGVVETRAVCVCDRHPGTCKVHRPTT